MFSSFKDIFASFGILIIWGTPITNISMRLPPQIPYQTHLPAARGPGICSPSDCHLQTLGSLCHPPACSWASTCGQRRAVPDMWTHSLEVKPTQLNKRSSSLSDHQRESRFHPASDPDPSFKWSRVLNRMNWFFSTSARKYKLSLSRVYHSKHFMVSISAFLSF